MHKFIHKHMSTYININLQNHMKMQRLGRYVLWPSSGDYGRTREPTRNFEPRPLFNPRRLFPLTITGYKYSCIVTRQQSGSNQQTSDDYFLEV